ncbi:DUF6151 family protein [Novosphingobium sp. B 225]|uniref:DUF6151 family protein n=1 Tax=Novosphingobium sp. B 225 TaxID=1961849 RepID=UPI000B4ABA99|nr:DUF6151 family protein [Novosphingobium sp. B 225]
MSQMLPVHVLRCACGAVECRASGDPIGTAVCYCDDCQAAAHSLAERPGAAPAADEDGGTALTLFHRKRFTCTRGADRLEQVKLRSDSATFRMIATCCDSMMYLGFERGPFWVSTLCNRFIGPVPPVEFRHMTRYRTSSFAYPDQAPRSKGFAPRFVGRTIKVGLLSLLGRY